MNVLSAQTIDYRASPPDSSREHKQSLHRSESGAGSGSFDEEQLHRTTDWRQVSLIIVSGIIGAAQIGKAAIALPVVQSDLQLTLVAVSWIVSAYAILGAFGGMAAGFLASFFAMRRVLIAGLGLIAIGSFMGAGSFGMPLLILSRVVEGVGFLAVAIAGPTLLRTVVSVEDRPLVLSTWSSYIPVGAAFMMLAGPFIMQGEWRVLWLFNGAVAAAHAVLVARVRPAGSQIMPEIVRPEIRDVMTVLRTRHLQLLAFTFLLYTTQYFALATFLPVFLVGRLGFSLSQAGTISAIALSANAVGNILAGLFLKRGVPLWAIITAAFLTIGITGFGIFLDASPVLLVFAAAGLCFGVSALLPASIISTVPQYAPSSRKLAMAMGVIQQSSGFGQMIGPALIALWVQQLSWNTVPYMFAAIASLGLAVAILVRQQQRGS